MIVYLRRRPVSLLSVVHANIPLRLPLRNAIRQSASYRRSIAASPPLVPAKATEGARALLLLRPQRCTLAAVVPLVPAKARERAGAWLLLRRQYCTVAAAVMSHERFRTASAPLLPAKATEGAGDLLPLLPQRCTVAAAVVSHERFRTITMTTAVLRRRPRDTRRAHLRLVPGSSASLISDSRSRAAAMWPQLLWLRTKQMKRWWMTVPLNSPSSLIICHLDRLISWKIQNTKLQN